MAHIKTFARIKPHTNQYHAFEHTDSRVYIRLPEGVFEGAIHAHRSKSNTVSHEFCFGHVFSSKASQEEVFQLVAKGIVEGFLAGYNGTIFAYGQTGSGKTYTVEGGARRYADRGLAPRAISLIYKALESRQDEDIQVHVSYMEIYQETGYDLLSPAARIYSVVPHFPKVSILEGPGGGCMMRNLTTHQAVSEDVAQSLLLQGQANRHVAETPLNQRSSRSHAVFTIQLAAKKHNSDIITRSKLHLVDLAGSERVSKSGVDGQQLSEAKFINLSLHHLESVIIALQQEASEQTRSNRWNSSVRPGNAGGGRHIPYRNSLLTMLLRDSLGGNCQTVMIATLSMEFENVMESISTCRFAQRVACITNTLRRNEEIDDKSMIQRLRRRLAELETEVAMLRAGQVGEEGDRYISLDYKLTDEDKIQCVHVMQGYMGGKVRDPITAGITHPVKFLECLRILKVMLLELYTKGASTETGVLPVDEELMFRVIKPTPHRPLQSPAQADTITDTKHGYRSSTSARPADPAEDGTPSKAHPAELTRTTVVKRPVSNSSTGKTKSDESGIKPVVKEPSYKSPFERQKEKEISHLMNVVDKASKTQKQDERQIEEKQVEIKLQQLNLIKTELQVKMKNTDQHVMEQQRYIEQLKSTGIDTDLISQEKLVERQLRKRQLKMKKRFDIVDSEIGRLNGLKHKANTTSQQKTANTQNPDNASDSQIMKSQQDTCSTVDKQWNRSHKKESGAKQGGASLEDKFPEYVRKSGKVNTRMVLEMLQAREKKQEKKQKDLEVAKLYTKDQELQLKEAATRQKLLEFKMRHSASKEGRQPPSSEDRNVYSSSMSDEDKLKCRSAADVNTQPPASRTVPAESDSAIADPSPSHSSKPNSSAPGFLAKYKHLGAHLTNTQSAISQAGSRETPKRTASSIWGSAYVNSSRPPTGQSTRSDHYTQPGFAWTPIVSSSPIKDSAYEEIPTDLMTGDQKNHTDWDVVSIGDDEDGVAVPESSRFLVTSKGITLVTATRSKFRETPQNSWTSDSLTDSQKPADRHSSSTGESDFDSALKKMLGSDHKKYTNGITQKKSSRTTREPDSFSSSPSRHRKHVGWTAETEGTSRLAATRLNSDSVGKLHQTGDDSCSSFPEENVKIEAMRDEERESHYLTSAKEQKERISRIRKAMSAAETIQRAWRSYKQRHARKK